MIQINTPSIQSSAMLVDLSISKWEGRKKEKQVTESVAHQALADQQMLNTTKRLLDCAELKQIKTLAGAMGVLHRKLTLPWGDSGMRILSNTGYIDYHQQMTAHIQQFNDLVDKFMLAYDHAIQQAARRLGTLYNPADYPSRDAVRRKFGVKLNYMPLPASGDFRLDIPQQAQQELQAQYERAFTERMEQAVSDIWHKLHGPLANMSQRLDYRDGDAPSRFRDTLVSNVQEIADVMRTTNITNDPKIEAIRLELVQTLKGVTPEGLRTSSALRERTKLKVDKILTQIPSLEM